MFTFGHEMAHNMGCNHDKGARNKCNSADYRYGFRDPAGDYRSVLAYDCKKNQCDDNPGGTCTRLPFFSTPDKFLTDGRPMGNPDGVGVGVTNNARRINERAEYISNFYSRLSPTPPPMETQSVRSMLLFYTKKY